MTFIPIIIDIIFWHLDVTCSCHDLISENGFGSCQKKSSNDHFKGSPVCYVNQPSNCTDLYTSVTNPGEKASAEACKIGEYNLLIMLSINLSIILGYY